MPPNAVVAPRRDDAIGSDRPAQAFPDWFTAFLSDRQTRKPSAHTMKAYRQDFVTIACLLTAGRPDLMALSEISREKMRHAFATYAATHEAASIRRCWSTWNVLCTFLYTTEQLDANPMSFVGRPKLAKTLPKALPRAAVNTLLDAVAQDVNSKNRTVWAERDLALILTSLLTGLRAGEMRVLDIGDIRTLDDGGAVVHVRGKGGKERRIPIEADLLSIIAAYLDSRAVRFPHAVKRTATEGFNGLARWSANAPVFVGRDGQRITRGALQSRVKRAFKLAGPDAQPVPGALVHGFRHTYATELAGADVSVYTLMKLLGHESMTTSQRYVTAAGSETRSAAAQNPLYGLLREVGRRPAPATTERS